MQIEKINNNQLEITLNIEDLRKNNISLHSFMCNSVESQNLFFNILNYADKEIGFSLENYEVIIEAFSIPIKSSFVLLITRVPKSATLHISKKKYGTLKLSKAFFVRFNNLDDFCMFCNSLNGNLEAKSSLYLLHNYYFLHIKIAHIKDFMKVVFAVNEFSDCIYDKDFLLDENADCIIEDFAIQTCKKYFV